MVRVVTGRGMGQGGGDLAAAAEENPLHLASAAITGSWYGATGDSSSLLAQPGRSHGATLSAGF